MTLFQTLLLLATFLNSLVAGFLFAFAVVVMPGFRSLDAGGFLRAFQVIDRVIQNGQPLFILVWVGSALSLMAGAMMSLWKLSGANRLLVIVAAFVCLVGVQLPTIAVNIPLNNSIQRLDSSTMDEMTRQHAREEFEPRWNRWNLFRTGCASVVTALLLIVLLRL